MTAVEPDEAMLAELRRQLPSVRALHGPAEAIPLADGSVDAVLCAQSMHWFDMSRALPEIARVLVPGGALGAMWNSDDDRVEWVAGLRDVAQGAGSPVRSQRERDATAFGAEQFGNELFTPTDRAEFANPQARTIDSLIDDLRTHSAVLIMDPAERERVLGRVRALPGVASGDRERGVRAADGHLDAPLGPSLTARSRAGYRVQTWLPRPNLRRCRPANCTTRPCTGHSPMPTLASCGS